MSSAEDLRDQLERASEASTKKLSNRLMMMENLNVSKNNSIFDTKLTPFRGISVTKFQFQLTEIKSNISQQQIFSVVIILSASCKRHEA